MKLYFVGIGGIGTSALAQLCVHRGDTVLGSNLGKTAIWPQLEQAGITLFEAHKSDQLPPDTDFLIYSEAVPEDNPERDKARELNIPEQSYFQYLGEVSKDYRTIAITGTHGKTTTSAMMAAGLIQAHFPATMIVGSKLKEFNGSNFYQSPGSKSAANGEPGLLLVEACEYRNNFQHLNPEVVVLTNLELDHVDYYRDEAHYIETFTNFCNKAKTVIYHADSPLIEQVLADFEGDKICVRTSRDLSQQVPGQHNRDNAHLALAAAEEIVRTDHYLSLQAFTEGVQNYTGAWRRLEHLGNIQEIEIYDDYGHHPTEIKATLQALREKHPDSKIGLIFEPHQYSRTKEFFTEFTESFTHADFTALYPIYAARDTEADKKSISRKDFNNVQLVDDLKSAQSFSEKLSPGDVLVFMGAGVIDQLAHQFVE